MNHEQLQATADRIFLDAANLMERLMASDDSSECKRLLQLIEIVQIYIIELGRFKGEVTGNA